MIYIPIWLDLLYDLRDMFQIQKFNLHSNMVRFIIIATGVVNGASSIFTFQYG